MPALCCDGYDCEGYIEADEFGLYEAISFTYRPSTSEENQALQIRYNQSRDDARLTNKATVDFLKAHLIRWDVAWTAKNGAKTPAEIDDKALSGLAGLIRMRLLNIVQGAGRSDRKPGQPAADEPTDREAARGN